MTLDILMAIVSEAYPDALVWQCYKHPRKSCGDTLAKFIAIEIKETFNADKSDVEQLCEARRVMTMALDEINEVCDGLDATIRDRGGE